MTTVWALDATLESRWTDYVARHPQATLFHELCWRDLLLSAFKHRPWYLVAERAGPLPVHDAEAADAVARAGLDRVADQRARGAAVHPVEVDDTVPRLDLPPPARHARASSTVPVR